MAYICMYSDVCVVITSRYTSAGQDVLAQIEAWALSEGKITNRHAQLINETHIQMTRI